MPGKDSADERVTLATVAHSVGVSLATVSKVINGHADVASRTRERIQQALTEHGYVSRPRRRLSSARATLELVFDGFSTPYELEIIRGVSGVSSRFGTDVVINTCPDDPSGAQWARDLTTAGRVGLIVVTSTMTSQQCQKIRDTGIPLVVIDPVDLPDETIPSIGATNWRGGLAATRHLIELGHRRIAAIGGPVTSRCSQARLHGYRAALEAAGLPVEADLMRNGDFGFTLGFRNAQELLDLDPRPTAIFAGSDLQAFGTLEAARTRGLRVPHDLSVVGFDDLPMARWATPPLTTVRQPLVEIGRLACRTVLRMHAGEQPDTHQLELATELIIRESTTPPLR